MRMDEKQLNMYYDDVMGQNSSSSLLIVYYFMQQKPSKRDKIQLRSTARSYIPPKV